MTKQIAIGLFLLGIIIGICLSKMFTFSTAPPPFIKQSIIIPAATQAKNVAQIEEGYKNKLDTLRTKEAIITGQLNATKQLLNRARNKTLLLQSHIRNIIKGNKAGDTILSPQSCDTLKDEVNKMMIAQVEKDSMNEAVTAILEQQVQTKDTVISLQQQQYGSLKTAFDNSLSQQKILESQVKQYDKYINRLKLKKKITTVAIMVLSVLTAKYLLR